MNGLLVLAALVVLAATVAGCESTQDKSARLAAELGPVRQEKGLKITKESEDVEVVATELLTDQATSAVVVTLQNNADMPLVDVPILIDVVDAKGKIVYSNDIPGIEPALASMPYIEANSQADWVHNQVLATGKPTSVEVEVGEGGRPYTAEMPEVDVSSAELEGDPTSGVSAVGRVTNHTDERLGRLLIYGVAREGEEIVAAGRAAIDHINPGRTQAYHVYFVGDPREGDVTITSFPPLQTKKEDR